jgi:Domain of unknown function (DUF4411)
MLYLIDANILITAHNDYYPIDGVPEFWDWLMHQASIEAVKMPLEIYEEIKLGGKDAQKDMLYKWVADGAVKKTLVLTESVSAPLVATCTKTGYAPDLNDNELLQMGRDPFLIAYAMASPKDRCVVTNEVSAPTKHGKTERFRTYAQQWASNAATSFR